MTGHSKRKDASKELIEFLTKFSSLLGDHLTDINKNLADTTDAIMNKISQINNTQSQNLEKANAILVKEENLSDANQVKFKEKNPEQLDNNEQNELKKELNGSKIYSSGDSCKMKGAGDKLKSEMGSLNVLDKKLEEVLMKMTGVLSIDDVLRQRLLHIISGIDLLKNGLIEVLDDFDKHYSRDNVDKITQKLEKNLFKIYTMEQEKDDHNKVFRVSS